jgi:16S rRNA (guanine1207-N2)-methyltransferase
MMGRGSRKRPDRTGGTSRLATDYLHWTTVPLVVAGREVLSTSKPGVPGHGVLDPARGLLLDSLDVGPGESLMDLHCGTGLVGVHALRHLRAGRVWMCDRNHLAVEASRRTLVANGIEDVRVTHGSVPEPFPADVDVATIRLPVGRLPTLHQIWAAMTALRPGGRCLLAGANDEGIRTALRQLEQIAGNLEVLGYRGGNRVGVAVRPAHLPPTAEAHRIPWSDEAHFHRFTAETPAGPVEILTRPGVFSWDRLDAGSRALLDTMRIEPGDDVLDIGCGYGVVGVAAARLSRTGTAVLVDVDAEAVRSARRTVLENGLDDRVEVLPGDAAGPVGERRFDVVVTNPPFHLGKGTNLDIPAHFIRDAARVLKPGGRLYLVANRTLPYERWLDDAFGEHTVIRDGREFKVLSAVAPARR